MALDQLDSPHKSVLNWPLYKILYAKQVKCRKFFILCSVRLQMVQYLFRKFHLKTQNNTRIKHFVSTNFITIFRLRDF